MHISCRTLRRNRKHCVLFGSNPYWPKVNHVESTDVTSHRLWRNIFGDRGQACAARNTSSTTLTRLNRLGESDPGGGLAVCYADGKAQCSTARLPRGWLPVPSICGNIGGPGHGACPEWWCTPLVVWRYLVVRDKESPRGPATHGIRFGAHKSASACRTIGSQGDAGLRICL